MDILVYGAGAIGGYLGSRLFADGHQVALLDQPAVAERINTEGLLLTEAGHTISIQPPAVSSLEEAFTNGAGYDLVLIALKSFDLDMILEPLIAVCPQSTSILTVQNGIGIEDMLLDKLSPGQLIAASLTTPVRKADGKTLVVERSDRGLALAPTAPGQDVQPWVDLFQSAGITTIGLDNYEAMKWSKALLNMVGNASSAILNQPPGEIYQDPIMFGLEVRMLRETAAVMAAQNIPVVNLPGSAAKTLASAIKWVPQLLLKPILTKIVAGGRGDKMPSFYIDLVSGRGKSEVIYHNGAVARIGNSVGVQTPVNQILNDVLVKLTNGELDRQAYEHNPQKLLANIQALE